MSDTASGPSAAGRIDADSLHDTWRLLRYTYALVPIVAGLDKFANLLVNWGDYLNPVLVDLLPVAPTTFMWLVGLIEIAAGVAVLTRWTREAAYVVALWLVLIAVNLVVAGQFDVAVRDVVMAIGAVALARLTPVSAPAD